MGPLFGVFCHGLASGRLHPPAQPVPPTRLWRYQGGSFHLITTVPGDTSAVSLMAWYPPSALATAVASASR